ncbi:tubulin polyglutamylase TTLL11-like [Acanthaster planci]|uniref:Tubulin polyglutamylase TTLL11-like n=1 Tax=Acanthaster planci TaxID=133434 RepID=A0A8B7XVG1_ACAPL|nr:tubulin polyglutamylase TTLL11-like [Acanthaster planci]
MTANPPHSRRNSGIKLDPIAKTDLQRTFINSQIKSDVALAVTVHAVAPLGAPRRCNTTLLRNNNAETDPSPEWVVAKQTATPPPPPACRETLEAMDTTMSSSPIGGKKKSKGRRARRRPVRPCLTVHLSKARSGAEVLRISLEELGWRWREVCGTRKSSCDLYWHSASFYDTDGIYSGMVNKYPGLLELVRKAQLSKLLHQMHELFPDEYDFYPRTWLLPDQYHHFCANVAGQQQQSPSRAKPVFIVKPDEGSQGDGIYLITDPRHMGSVGLVRRAVVQEYIAKPLLLERTKFDLRVYVLLTSIAPLRIHICREGMARFCTIKYQPPTNRNLHQIFMHLTNYSLNKRSETYIHTDSTDRGSKRTMSSTFAALASRGHNTIALWEDIQAIVIKTITAMLPDLLVEYEAELPARKPAPSCFQILGFDILVTEDLKPMLLEVNANPSLRLDYEKEVSPGITESQPSPVDEEIKIPLIKDTLKLLKPCRAGREARARLTAVKPDKTKASRPATPISDNPASEEEEDEEGGGGAKEGEKEEWEDDSCLEEIWPQKFGECYSHLRVMEHVAGLFNRFLGVRGAHRMGATGFRMFSRKCKLCTNGITMAGIDIMYIDITRRWTLDNPEGVSTGMCFGAFLEAFFTLAQRKFRGSSLLDKVSALVELCEYNLSGAAGLGGIRAGAPPRLLLGRLRRPEMGKRRVGRWPSTDED